MLTAFRHMLQWSSRQSSTACQTDAAPIDPQPHPSPLVYQRPAYVQSLRSSETYLWHHQLQVAPGRPLNGAQQQAALTAQPAPQHYPGLAAGALSWTPETAVLRATVWGKC